MTSSLTYSTKQLTQEVEIRAAQRLLYRVYREELGWQPEPSNPSGICFVEEQGELLLVDDYDPVATWFGTFFDGQLIACWRCTRPQQAQFEVERYHPIPEFLRQGRTMELARLAIEPEHRRKPSVLQQLACTTRISLSHDVTYLFATAQFPMPGALYLRLGAKLTDTPPFKYSPLDPHEVQLIYFDFDDPSTLVSKRLKQRQQPHLHAAHLATP